MQKHGHQNDESHPADDKGEAISVLAHMSEIYLGVFRGRLNSLVLAFHPGTRRHFARRIGHPS